MSEEIKETPTGELEQGEFKMKKKPKKLTNKKTKTTKVDLSKKPEKTENAVQAQKTDDSNAVIEEKKNEASSEKVVEEVRSTKEEEIKSPIVEIIEEEKEEVKELKKEVKEAVRDEKVVGKKLPENIEKLVSFMEDTGGTVEDYVRLNADYSQVDDTTLVKEYYKKTKPHLNQEEIEFMLDDNFSYDEDVDEEREIKKKKLAFKEEIAEARNFLEQTKSKYYDEIKLRPGVTQEQKKAMDFFNRYNEEQKMVANQHDNFVSDTKNYFTNDFKGFDFNIGEKKFRYGVSNVDEVIDKQSNLSTFVKKFLNEDGSVNDYKGYHKAIYAARNADTIANHFYEQGKADAVKDVMAKSKNINNEPRAAASGDVFINGLKVKAINGVDSSKLKIKTRKNN